MITRLSFKVPPHVHLSALEWLHGQDDPQQIYWSDRNTGLEIAGSGATHSFQQAASVWQDNDIYQAIQARLADADPASRDEIRYFGGIRFDRTPGAPVAPEWRAFGHVWFVLPRFEWRVTSEGAVFSCHLMTDTPQEAEETKRVFEQKCRELSTPSSASWETLPPWISRTNFPGEAGWKENIREALRLFTQGELKKIVLARRVLLSFDRPVNSLALFRELKSKTFNCFHFYFSPEKDAAFMGATPERLYRRKGGRVLSEAVAGTRARGASPEQDHALKQELLNTEKDRREHRYVIESIQRTLNPLCSEILTDPEVSVTQLARAQHLYCRIEGLLKPGIRDQQLVDQLHPTPAVGGTPTKLALQEIRRLEPFNRGWYAAPVGWVSHNAAEFAVALRSALVTDEGVSLCSGAGILAGSDPDSEWREIEMKISDYLRILNEKRAEH